MAPLPREADERSRFCPRQLRTQSPEPRWNCGRRLWGTGSCEISPRLPPIDCLPGYVPGRLRQRKGRLEVQYSLHRVRFALAPAQPAPRFEAAGVYLLLVIFDNESGIRWVSESGRVLIRSTNGSSPEQRLMKFQPEKLQARACIFFKHLSGACFAPPFLSQREPTTPGSFRPRRGRSNGRERGSPRAPSTHAGR